MNTIGLQPTILPPDTTRQQSTMSLIRTLIEDHIKNQPRSLQKRIGPSEIGTECAHCLAAKLAGWEKTEPVAWLPFIGTAVHAYLERLFTELNNEVPRKNYGDMFLCEQKVMVGQVGGEEIWGSTDLYLPNQIDSAREGMTVDWKIVGNNTLNKAKRSKEPSLKYQVQAHLYAKGWNDGGHPTSHVCVYFMPRNSLTLDDGYIWIDEYRPQVAEAALERANSIANNLAALETISTETRDSWISSLERAPDCQDCKKYPDWHASPAGATDLNMTLNINN